MEDGGPVAPDARLIDMMIARDAIEARVNRLCIDLDNGDEAAACAAFTLSAICSHGPFRGSARNYVGRVIARQLPGLSPYGWHLTSHRAGMAGATAWAETYAIAGATAGEEGLMCGLRLLDTLENCGGAWLIARRETVLDWTFRWPCPDAADPARSNGQER